MRSQENSIRNLSHSQQDENKDTGHNSPETTRAIMRQQNGHYKNEPSRLMTHNLPFGIVIAVRVWFLKKCDVNQGTCHYEKYQESMSTPETSNEEINTSSY